MNVVWTERAYARLAEIHEYIAADNPTAADRLVDALLKKVDRLARYPKSGRQVPELSTPTIRELIYKRYRVVYRARGDAVEILTVFEGHLLLVAEELEDE